MLVTAKSEYAVRAMIELASEDSGLLSTKQVASRQQIPEVYLKQILSTLRQAGLLRVEHGVKGGYALNGEPGEISIRQIVEVVESEIKSSYCKDKGEEKCGEFYLRCGLREVWDRAEEAYLSALEEFTLKDFLGFRKPDSPDEVETSPAPASSE